MSQYKFLSNAIRWGVFVALLIGCASATAQVPGGTSPGEVRRMSLQEILQTMLKRNPTLARERLTIQKASADLVRARGAFSFDLDLNLRVSGSNLPADSQVDPQFLAFIQGELSLNSVNLDGSVGISKRFQVGTVLSATFQNIWTEFDSINFLAQSANPEENKIRLQRMTGALTLRVTQPLLRNAWLPVNLAPVYQAAARVKVVRQQVSATAAQQVLQTIQAYWDLVYALRNVSIQQSALKLAKKQLQQTMALIKAGKTAELEQFQVKQVVAARQGDLLLAREQELAAGTQLRILLNYRASVQVQPKQTTGSRASLPQVADLIRSARSQHPQVLIAQHQQTIARWGVKAAKNRVLPQLDITGSFTLAGSGRTFPPRNGQPASNTSPAVRTYETLFDPRFHRFFIGINLKIPLDNRQAQGSLASQQIELQRTQMQIDLLRRQYTLQVMRLHAQARRNLQRLRITQTSLLWAKKKLEAEQNKLEVGQSILFRVLQFQQDLAAAQLSQLRAFVDYHKTLANLHHTAGVILEKYGVVSKK